MISAGGEHSLVTSCKAGEVWSFGCGGSGRLGHGGRGDEAVPRLIEAMNHAVVVHLAAGGEHSMALMRDGDVWTWGRGSYGQLGHGDNATQLVPKRVEGLANVTDIAAGTYHSMAVGGGGAVLHMGV